MRLCLGCGHLWPVESIYCPRCQRTFGQRLCPHGHSNPLYPATQTCILCNDGPLTEAVFSLPLGGLVRLLTLALLLVGARLLWQHLGCILTLLWETSVRLLAFVLGTSPCDVKRRVYTVLTWLLVLWLGSYLLPGGWGQSIRQGLRLGWRGLGHLLRSLGRLVRRLVLPQH